MCLRRIGERTGKVRSGSETVASRALGDQVLRIVRIRLDLAPKLTDHYPDVFVILTAVTLPYGLSEFAIRYRWVKSYD